MLRLAFHSQCACSLSPIIKPVLFCARQHNPLCGRRDDSKHYETLDTGNFQALFDFRVDSDDVILKDHFATASRHATYIHNDIIPCCAHVVNRKIISEIKHYKHFSILADEVTDYANTEQIPIVLKATLHGPFFTRIHKVSPISQIGLGQVDE